MTPEEIAEGTNVLLSTLGVYGIWLLENGKKLIDNGWADMHHK